MYIFEWIIKYIKGKNKSSYPNSLLSESDVVVDEECKHFFMPIDSDGKILACKYCGLLIDRDKHK